MPFTMVRTRPGDWLYLLFYFTSHVHRLPLLLIGLQMRFDGHTPEIEYALQRDRDTKMTYDKYNYGLIAFRE